MYQHVQTKQTPRFGILETMRRVVPSPQWLYRLAGFKGFLGCPIPLVLMLLAIYLLLCLCLANLGLKKLLVNMLVIKPKQQAIFLSTLAVNSSL